MLGAIAISGVTAEEQVLEKLTLNRGSVDCVGVWPDNLQYKDRLKNKFLKII